MCGSFLLPLLQEELTMLGALVSDYGNTELDGMPEIPDMEAMLKSQLDQRLEAGRTPLAINTFYEW